MKNNPFKTITLLVLAITLIAVACKKKDYYIDGGLLSQPEFEKKMSTYDFLASRPNHMFDSLIKVIDMTGTKAIVNQSNITFYAIPNAAIMRFQRRFNVNDKLPPRPLAKIGLDTLKMLLNRYVIPNADVTLEQIVIDKVKYYKDNNADSINVYRAGGGVNAGSSIQTSAYNMEYEHRKIKKVDSINYKASIQTHNLVTLNARIHVLRNDANFSGGLKLKYFRTADKND